MTRKKHFDLCTIMRRVEITTSTMNLLTGRETFVSKRIEIQPCGTPLFSDLERRTGICRSCHEGWSVEGNKFANTQELERAVRG